MSSAEPMGFSLVRHNPDVLTCIANITKVIYNDDGEASSVVEPVETTNPSVEPVETTNCTSHRCT